jgi:hypothetical protein
MGSMTVRVDGHRVVYHDYEGGGSLTIGDCYIGTFHEEALGLFTGAVSWEESSKRLGVVMEAMASAYLLGQENAAQGRFV